MIEFLQWVLKFEARKVAQGIGGHGRASWAAGVVGLEIAVDDLPGSVVGGG